MSPLDEDEEDALAGEVNLRWRPRQMGHYEGGDDFTTPVGRAQLSRAVKHHKQAAAGETPEEEDEEGGRGPGA